MTDYQRVAEAMACLVADRKDVQGVFSGITYGNSD